MDEGWLEGLSNKERKKERTAGQDSSVVMAGGGGGVELKEGMGG